MPSAMDADQRDLMRIEALQLLTVAYRDQPVFGAVQDISMTIHFSDPLVRVQMIS